MIQGDKSDKREYYYKKYSYVEIVPYKKTLEKYFGYEPATILRRALEEDRYVIGKNEKSIHKSGKVFIYEEDGIAYEFFSGKSLGIIKGWEKNRFYKYISEYGFNEFSADDDCWDDPSYLYHYWHEREKDSSECFVKFSQDAQKQTEQDKKQALIYLELRKEYHQRREKERLRREKEKLEKEQQAASWAQNIISQRGK